MQFCVCVCACEHFGFTEEGVCEVDQVYMVHEVMEKWKVGKNAANCQIGLENKMGSLCICTYICAYI